MAGRFCSLRHRCVPVHRVLLQYRRCQQRGQYRSHLVCVDRPLWPVSFNCTATSLLENGGSIFNIHPIPLTCWEVKCVFNQWPSERPFTHWWVTTFALKRVASARCVLPLDSCVCSWPCWCWWSERTTWSSGWSRAFPASLIIWRSLLNSKAMLTGRECFLFCQNLQQN